MKFIGVQTLSIEIFPAYISTVRHLKIANKAKNVRKVFLDYKQNKISKNEVHNKIMKVKI
jgi:hypothetical protein